MDNKLLRLPPGFRFHPTDEELVVQYLRRKVFSCPLPASFIPEITLGENNPWDLLVGCEEERYFFNLRDAKHANRGHGRWNRATGSGYWKGTGKDKVVVSSKCNRVVGTKKAFVFYQGRAPKAAGGAAAERTDWIMHEYRLASPTGRCGIDAATREWALCRVFKKKKRATKMMDVEEEGGATEFRFVDFMNHRGPPSPSGSESSCVTEAATDVPGGGEDVSSSP